MKSKKFTCYDLFVNLISLLTFLVDIGTDILVVVVFYERGDVVWGSLSVTFIILPAIVMQFFSVKWYHNDNNLTFLTFLPHLLLLGPVFRYLGVIKLGLRTRQKTGGDVSRNTDTVFTLQNDISILRLIEALLESAPQLCLTLYIFITTLSLDWLTGISAVTSLISLSWSLTAYTDALRLAYQDGYTRRWIGLIVHSLWHTCMTASRVMALVLFASVFKVWIFLVIGSHWLVMTVMISIQGIDFGDGCVETSLFRLVAGFIHIFCFLNVKDGPTRCRMAVYYMIIFIENSALWILWFIYSDLPSLIVVTAVIVFACFVFGLLFLILYYRFLHPSGSVRVISGKPVVYQQTIIRRGSLKADRIDRPDVFNNSDSVLDYNQSQYSMVDLSLGSPGHTGSQGLPGHIGSPFVHSNTNTPCSRSATDRNLMAIWESSSQLHLNSMDNNIGNEMKVSQSKISVCSDQTHLRSTKNQDPDYSIMYNEGTDGLMFKIRSQKELRHGGDCSPYSVTNLSLINFIPGSLSPLDAHKLWEESNRRLENSPLSSASSHSSISTFVCEKSNHDNIRHNSISSTSSSLFFNDNNITVCEALPPHDEASIYSFISHPVIIKPEPPYADQFVSMATVQQGSVRKLGNPPNDRKHFLTEQTTSSYRNQNKKKHISFSTSLVEPEPQKLHEPPGYYDGLCHPRFYPCTDENTVSTQFSPNQSISSYTSPRSTDEPQYINSSVLSDNSCCSPTFPFIDESCSESGGSSSSMRPPCNPKKCYMSAITQIADKEVAITMQNGIEDMEDLTSQDNLKSTNVDDISDNNMQNVKIQISNEAISQTNRPVEEGNLVSPVRSPPSYKEACQRSKVLAFINDVNQHVLTTKTPQTSSLQTTIKEIPVPDAGVHPSHLPITSQRTTDAPWRLDYLNIEPSPSINYTENHNSGENKRPTAKYSQYRLNISDPGSTPLKLQHFDDSPAKFGRNIDLFKKGDWKSLQENKSQHTRQSSSRGSSSHRPLSGNFEIMEMVDEKENHDIDPNSLSPPLQSSSLQTSVARKRVITRQNSQKRNEDGSHYIKAQPTGSKFTGIKRHSDYVQYGKVAKDREICGPLRKRNHQGNQLANSRCYDSFDSSHIEGQDIRRPFTALENNKNFSSNCNGQFGKNFNTNTRFSVTPKKATSLNIVSDDIIHTNQPMIKWAPTNLNHMTPDGRSKPRRKTSSARRKNIQPGYQMSKTRSMEHLY